jgi:type III pantothenate kinase
MKPDLVVDLGNTRIKWGLCNSTGREIAAMASLPDDPAEWDRQIKEWNPRLTNGPGTWVLASVQPRRCDRLREWIELRGGRAYQIDRASQLSLAVALPEPQKAGMDRLLNAVAAQSLLPANQGAVLIDAGSAVTVDWLDEQHTFQGGAIFPGIRLMADALHRNTALLPLVEVADPVPDLPAKATIPAIRAGIYYTIVGGIRNMVQHYLGLAKSPPRVFLTGGDGALLHAGLKSVQNLTFWPEQTLIGIARAAEQLP